MERRDPYRILHVIPTADQDVIRAAYRVLVRKLHPDAGAPVDEAMAAKISDLNWAYAQVRDAPARERWERERLLSAPPTSAQPRTHGAARPDLAEDGANARLDFGRYEGWTLREIAARDREYLMWLRRHASGARYRPAIERVLREKTPRR